MLCKKILESCTATTGVVSYIFGKNRELQEFLEPITKTFSKDKRSEIYRALISFLLVIIFLI